MTREQLNKHWELVVALKNGAEIETKPEYFDDEHAYEETAWVKTTSPQFYCEAQYRIKKENFQERNVLLIEKAKLNRMAKYPFEARKILDVKINVDFPINDEVHAENLIENELWKIYNSENEGKEITEEPKYRPWTLDEVPIGKVVTLKNPEKNRKTKRLIVAADSLYNSKVLVCVGEKEKNAKDAKEMLEFFVMEDGSPCGIRI